MIQKVKLNLPINNLGSSTIQHNAVSGQANMSGTRYTGTDLTGR